MEQKFVIKYIYKEKLGFYLCSLTVNSIEWTAEISSDKVMTFSSEKEAQDFIRLFPSFVKQSLCKAEPLNS